MKGPAIFLAQFAGDQAPFNNLDSITRWAGELGYQGVQVPTWESSLIDLEKAASSKDYCDELKGICANNGVEITELSTHLQAFNYEAAHRFYKSNPCETLYSRQYPKHFQSQEQTETANYYWSY